MTSPENIDLPVREEIIESEDVRVIPVPRHFDKGSMRQVPDRFQLQLQLSEPMLEVDEPNPF